MSVAQTVVIYADTRGKGHCKGCGALIEWAQVVASGRRMPFNVPILVLSGEPEPRTGRRLQTVDLARSHWGTCPDRDRFRRQGGAS